MARHIINHTSLRGIAAFCVCWGHYTDVFARDVAGMNFFVPHTHLGVDIFFMLSGFILYHVYAKDFSVQVTRAGWAAFMGRRILRIYPLHLLTLLAVIVLARFSLPPDGLYILGLNLTLTHAWGLADSFVYNSPSWSISAEFAAYLVFPFMAFAVSRWFGRIALVLLAAGCAVLLWRLGGGGLGLDDIGRDHVLLRVFLGFPVGVLLAWVFCHMPPVTAYLASVLQAAALLAFVAMLALGLAEIWLLLPFALLIFATAGDKGMLTPLLSLAPIHWLGTVSYGVYMLQWPLMLVMFNLDPKLQPYVSGGPLDLARIVIFLTLLLGSAALSWRWIEAPMIALAHKRAST